MHKRQYFKTNRTKIQDIKFIKHLKGFKEYPDSKEIIITHLKDVINTLGYDINSEFIYAVSNGNKYDWKTTINKKFIKSYWSNIYKKPEMFYEYYNFEDHILPHIFPLELKNKSSKNDSHYINQDMCGCNIKDNSDILVLDIDAHRNNSLETYNEIDAILHYFKEILYSEISSEGSYHVYIKLDKQYTFYERKQIFNVAKEKLNLLNTELPTKMRFPFSYHYQPYIHPYFTHEWPGIYSIIEATKQIIPNYQQQKGFNPQIEKQKIIKQEYKPSVIYGRQYKTTLIHQTPEQFLQNTNIIISANNRWLPMLEICRISNYNNWSSENTLDIIKQLDTGSNDLKKWNDTILLKNIKSIKDNSNTYYQESISHRPEKFISNIKHIPLQILPIIENKKSLNQIIIKSGYKLTNINKYKFSLCFKEFVGCMFYNTINNKQATKTKYLIGTQVSQQYCNMLKQHYGHLFKAFNPYSIITSILKHSNLFKQYKHNNRGWEFNPNNPEFNFCKQYDFINNKKHILLNNSNLLCYLIIEIFKLYFNNTIKQLYISKFFNKIKQNIKEIFEYNDEDMFPIPV